MVLSNSQDKNLRVPQWSCAFLRGLFLPVETREKSFSKAERIYISRKKASNRRIINEQEVINLLEKFAFKTITIESISVAQQASLLANSQVIVATHCAGLTNLVFGNPGTKVIEIFHPEYVMN